MDEDQKGQKTETAESEEVTNTALTVPFPGTFVYTNATAFSMTLMDIKIGFGEAMPNRLVEPRVGVTMSIEHAAHITLILFKQLQAYERNFGPIRHPEWQAVKQAFTAQEQASGTEGQKIPEK